jgi:hypothetical protein
MEKNILFYETAVKMYYREHDRWIQWALFFFGFISGIFVLSAKYPKLIPFALPCFVALLVSIMWVAVALNIRATTFSWEKVIKRIERNEEEKPFIAFHDELKQRERECYRIKEFKKTLCVRKSKSWQSVTQIMILLGILSSIVFFFLLTKELFGPWVSIFLLIGLFIKGYYFCPTEKEMETS